MVSTDERRARSGILRLGLLSTTCLALAFPASADGGAGGGGYAFGLVLDLGGAGGPGPWGTAGDNGSTSTGANFFSVGGGGGGGGAGGGVGGAGGARGGAGGNSGPGESARESPSGGGGGAGGFHGLVNPTQNNVGLINGTDGFAGGTGRLSAITLTVPQTLGGGGGGGGAGGYGVVVYNPGSFSNGGVITAGNGGAGGNSGGASGGNGGDGGVGVYFFGGTLTNSGVITAGSGGTGGLRGSGIGNVGTDGAGGLGGVGVLFVQGSSVFANSGTVQGGNGGNSIPTVGGGAGIYGSDLTVINSGVIRGGLSGYGLTQANAITFAGGTNRLELQAGSVITGGVVVVSGSGALTLGGNANSSFDASQIGLTAQYQGFATFEKTGGSAWTLVNGTAATTPWTISSGTLSISSDSSLGATAGGLTLAGGTLQATASFASARAVTLTSGGSPNTFNILGNSVSWSGNIAGFGGLVKTGTGTLNLTGNNSYSGGTLVSGGTLQGNSNSLQGNIVNNSLVVFQQDIAGTYAGTMSGSGSLTVRGGGQLIMTGNNTFSGLTLVSGTHFVVNGSLASDVAVNGGVVSGTGTLAGGVTVLGGTVAPGNSIGTLTVRGNFLHNGGAHQVEVNGAGSSDRFNVGGTASLSGTAVQLLAAPGSYASSTTYTILSASSGVSGGYTGISDNLAFLTPSLSYDANNAYLTLALQGNAFSAGGTTTNQRAAGSALDRSFAGASGDFATVIGALAGLTTTQGPAALDAISGQPYANFGTTNVANASLFMNTLGQQMASARGSAPSSRVALAQACEIEACDDPARPLTAWFSGLGGLGSVQGNANSSTLTYNVGGAAAGIDYRLNPQFLVGFGAGYAHGTQWTNGFMGQGWSDSVSAAVYGSFTHAGFYADALAGYAYLSNQMQRQIAIPNLQARTANGSAGANQFLAQVETGYRLGVWDTLSVTPFARLQTSITTQNAFSESGASSLSLNVAQQTTHSLRSVLGAEFSGSVPLGSARALDLSLRLGWQHEYASTARPITAALAGAPSASFTVYGATPSRNAALVGFSASTTIAEATQLYLRYDGMLGSGTDNHAFTAGLRLSW